MKKILFTVLAVLLISNITFANAPKWENIAPNKYAGQLEYKENKTFSHNHPYLDSLTCLTIVGIPFVLVSRNRSYEINKNNYWYKRQVEFNQQLALCEQMENQDNKLKCYMFLYQNEQYKTIAKEQTDTLENINYQVSRPHYSNSSTTQYGNTYYTNTYGY